MMGVPDVLKEHADKNIFMVAATLRPETLIGQTNVFVAPQGDYGLYKMKDGEYFICTEKAARNFAYQEVTEKFGEYECIARFKGSDLIGMPLKAPLS